eukprot:467110-Prymnesium_polylepis.1
MRQRLSRAATSNNLGGAQAMSTRLTEPSPGGARRNSLPQLNRGRTEGDFMRARRNSVQDVDADGNPRNRVSEFARNVLVREATKRNLEKEAEEARKRRESAERRASKEKRQSFTEKMENVMLGRRASKVERRLSRTGQPSFSRIPSGLQPQVKELFNAVTEGDVSTLCRLMTEGVPANATDDDGNTALILAAEGEPQCVEELLHAGCPIDHQNNLGLTALMIAVKYDDDALVKVLIDAGAEKSLQDVNGWTATDHAQGNPHVLRRFGADWRKSQGVGRRNSIQGNVTTAAGNVKDGVTALIRRASCTGGDSPEGGRRGSVSTGDIGGRRGSCQAGTTPPPRRNSCGLCPRRSSWAAVFGAAPAKQPTVPGSAEAPASSSFTCGSAVPPMSFEGSCTSDTSSSSGPSKCEAQQVVDQPKAPS